jgi:SM-20-related protein
LNPDNALLVHERRLDDNSIYVVDGLFRPDFVRFLHEMLKALPFSLSDYDTKATKGVRHWKHEFTLEKLAANPLLKSWHDAIVMKTAELSAGRKLELARVHCNNQPYGDLQHTHQDIVPGVTAVYFANHEWDENWQGELLLFDRRGEPFYAVAPKPGRLLVFAGDIPHRGGVPSRACYEPRLSVAFKFAAG